MAKRGVRRKPVARRIEVIDATPERLLKGDDSEFVNPAVIDSAQPIGLTRRFRVAHLDRLHSAGRLSYRQWYAGDWYRAKHAACGFDPALVANYSGGPSGAPGPSYNLARTEKQLAARNIFHKARAAIPANMLGYVDRLVIRDSVPPVRQRGAHRTLVEVGKALDTLADFLRFPSNG